MRRSSPNTAIQRARPVGTEVPADAWPAIFPEKPANSGDPSLHGHACKKVQVTALPSLIVQSLPGHNVLLYQPRLVATGQFRGDDEHGGISRIARLGINFMPLIKTIKIRWFFSMMVNFCRYAETA
jgi:hypothetical protein